MNKSLFSIPFFILFLFISIIFPTDLNAGCNNLATGWYKSVDEKMETNFHHNPLYPGVYGWIWFGTDKSQKVAGLENSICTNDHVILNWNSDNFKGYLEGEVSHTWPVEMNMHGMIDGKLVSNYKLRWWT